MAFLKWIAALALLGSAAACGNATPYRGDIAYRPGAYDYNQQPTYYGSQYANGQPTYGSRQPTYYSYQPAYGFPQQSYYGYQQPVYYGR